MNIDPKKESQIMTRFILGMYCGVTFVTDRED
jgi:hypothetical protein